MTLIRTLPLLATALILSACGSESSKPAAPAPKPAAEAAPAVALPADLIGSIEGAASSVAEARGTAKAGSPVVLTGYIGGREEPFTEGRALFLLADTKTIPQCTDHCKTPWDACCEAPEDIIKNVATIQVVDAEGHLIKTDLNGVGGLKPGATVTVSGTVAEAGESILIVNATRIGIQ